MASTSANLAVLATCVSIAAGLGLLTTAAAAGAAEACPNEAIRIEQNSTFLPDCRAYEMVSPPEKGGSDVMSSSTRTRAASDGSAAQFLSLGAFGDAQGTGISTEYMALREDTGWKTHSITPLQEPQSASNAVVAFDPRYIGDLSPDLGTGVYRSLTPLTPADTNVTGIWNLYVRRDLHTPGTGSYQLLTKAAEPVTANIQYVPTFAGASTDFSHILFLSPLNLTPDAPAETCTEPGFCDPRLYEYSDGGVSLVGLIPVPPATSCTGGECVPAERSIPGAAPSEFYHSVDTISHDGRRVFFTVAESREAVEGALYMREDETRTVQISGSEKTVPDASLPVKFQAASADGSKVFFTTEEELVNEDTNNESDLYRYDLNAPAGHRLTLLSANHGPAGQPFTSDVKDVYGVSDDGSYAYFSSPSQLVAGGPLVAPDELMVYAWHNGAVAFVGTVTTRDNGENVPENGSRLSSALARVTPDGTHLVFVSRSPNEPTHDSSDVCVERGEEPCRRLYVYSADADGGAGALACASCHSDGAPSTTNVITVASVGLGGTSEDPHLNRTISDDGRRVFFSTGDALVPGDHNGRQDVYEYDVPSGQVHLISAGTGGDSYFMDASADGGDVFFTTREQLVGSDQDNNVDLYDARIGGGFSEPQPQAPCAGDACQGPPDTPLTFDSPPTVGPLNRGNLTPPAVTTPPPHKLSNAQRLSRALKVCRKKHARARRKRCESRARRRFHASSSGRRSSSRGSK